MVTVETFCRVGLGTNLENTKYMFYTPGFIWGGWIEKYYKQRATGEEATFRERKRMQVSCTECGMNVAASSLKHHMERLHGICVPQMRGVDERVGGSTTYVVSFTRVLKLVKCLVPGCLTVVHSGGQLQENFMYQHFWSQAAVVQ